MEQRNRAKKQQSAIQKGKKSFYFLLKIIHYDSFWDLIKLYRPNAKSNVEHRATKTKKNIETESKVGGRTRARPRPVCDSPSA